MSGRFEKMSGPSECDADMHLDVAVATTAELRDLLDRAGRGEHVDANLILVQQELDSRTGEAEARARAEAALSDDERQAMNAAREAFPFPSRVTGDALTRLNPNMDPKVRASLENALRAERRYRLRVTVERRAVRFERCATRAVRLGTLAARRARGPRSRERRASRRTSSRGSPGSPGRPSAEGEPDPPLDLRAVA